MVVTHFDHSHSKVLPHTSDQNYQVSEFLGSNQLYIDKHSYYLIQPESTCKLMYIGTEITCMYTQPNFISLEHK